MLPRYDDTVATLHQFQVFFKFGPAEVEENYEDTPTFFVGKLGLWETNRMVISLTCPL